MKLPLLLIALALTTSTAQQFSPPQQAVLSKAIETLKSSSLVKYLTTYAIGAVEQGVSDGFTNTILTTYPQLADVRTCVECVPHTLMHAHLPCTTVLQQ